MSELKVGNRICFIGEQMKCVLCWQQMQNELFPLTLQSLPGLEHKKRITSRYLSVKRSNNSGRRGKLLDAF